MKFTDSPFDTSSYNDGAKVARNELEVAAVLVALEWLNDILEALDQEAINYIIVNWLKYAPGCRIHAVRVELSNELDEDELEGESAQDLLLKVASRVTKKEALAKIAELRMDQKEFERDNDEQDDSWDAYDAIARETLPAGQGLSSDILPPLGLAMTVRGIMEQAPSPLIGILLGGDRLSCCDEGIALRKDGDLLGIATIAPEGEERSGVPTIVGLYVLPQYRGQGYGALLLELAIRRCMQRGFPTAELTMLSSRLKRAFESLPEDLRSFATVVDHGDYACDMFAAAEEVGKE